MNRTEIAESTERQVKEELLRAGFERIDSRRVCLRIDANFLGWVGLNRGTVDGHLRVNPFVGVHSIPLMRAYYMARGERYVVGDVATFAQHLGEITPRATDFIVPDEASVAPVASDIATAITTHGVPFMRQIANYEALVTLLEPLAARFGGNPQKLALALHFQGKDAEAKALVLKTRSQLASEDPVLRESFEKFAAAFLSGSLK
jgi:hypothetical protein